MKLLLGASEDAAPGGYDFIFEKMLIQNGILFCLTMM